MALTADRDVRFYTSQELIDLPVQDGVRIWKGALVGLNTSGGYARPLVAGDLFLGIAYGQVDNTGVDHAAGQVRVRLHQMIDIVHALPGVTRGDVGGSVYASDDATLTLTAASNSRVGRVVAVEGTNVARVRCEPLVS